MTKHTEHSNHQETEASMDHQHHSDREHHDDSTIQPEQQHPVHGDHSGPGHQGHSGHGDMVADFKKRFVVSLVLALPILALSPMIQHFMGVNWRFDNDLYILFVLSSIVFFLRRLAIFGRRHPGTQRQEPGHDDLNRLGDYDCL